MKFWNAAPLLRIFLPFSAGIFTEQLFLCYSINSEAFILIVTLFLLLILTSSFYSFKQIVLYGYVLNVLLYLIGYEMGVAHTYKNNSNYFSKELKNSAYIHVRVDAPLIGNEKSIKTIVQLLSVYGQSVVPVTGKMLVSFQKDEQASKLNYGDELILENRLLEIPSKKNPGAFDYKKYMARKNIFLQTFLKKGQWVSTGKNSGNLLISQSIDMRNTLLSLLAQAQLKGDELAVASALVIGHTDKLDPDLQSAYAQTGAMHILSVSGLHVGIVFVAFNTVLFFLKKFRYGVYIKAILLILFLWFYAFISGLSPSVMRSATMFSFIICGKSFRRNSTVYNTIFASALLLLVFNPSYLMEVGFQLSYTAVLGIVIIQPVLSDFFKTTNRILKQLVSIITVSIAAQIATFPLSIYYFHMFPNYFVLTNLIAIPLSTVIIYSGIIMMVFSGSPFLLNNLSSIFSHGIYLLNNSIRWISRIPFAITEGIFINPIQLFILYLGIILLILFLYKRKVKYFYLLLGSLILLLGTQLVSEIQTNRQRKFVVYAVPDAGMMEFIYAKEHVVLSNHFDKLSNSATGHLKSYWMELGLKTPLFAHDFFKTETVYVRGGYIQFYDKRIVMLCNEKSTEQLYKMNDSMKVDYVVLSETPGLSIKEIRTVYHPCCIILDSSNKPYRIKQWENECIRLKQPFYSVMKSGAFQVEF